jgi:hypothetical protein
VAESALTLRGGVPNLDDAGFARIAGEAEKNCPVSKVLNAAITPGREARLVGRQEGDSVMARNHLPDQGASGRCWPRRSTGNHSLRFRGARGWP